MEDQIETCNTKETQEIYSETGDLNTVEKYSINLTASAIENDSANNEENEGREKTKLTTSEKTEISNEVTFTAEVEGNDAETVNSSTEISNEKGRSREDLTVTENISTISETELLSFDETSHEEDKMNVDETVTECENTKIVHSKPESSTELVKINVDSIISDADKILSDKIEPPKEPGLIADDITITENAVIKEEVDEEFAVDIKCEDFLSVHDGFFEAGSVKIEADEDTLSYVKNEDGGPPGLILNGVILNGALVNGLIVNTFQPLDNRTAVIRTKGETPGVLQNPSNSNQLQVEQPQSPSSQQLQHVKELVLSSKLYLPSTSNNIQIKREEEEEREDDASLKLLRCCLCGFRTSRVKKLTRHILLHSYKRTKYSCYKCSFQTALLTVLRRHILLNHTNRLSYSTLDSETNYPDNDSESGTGKQPSLLHNCSLCTYNTTSAVYFRAHTMLHFDVDNKIYKCSICSFTTESYTVIKSHENSHSIGKLHLCELCDYKTTKVGRMRKHNLMIHPDRFTTASFDYICGLCNYKTNQSSALRSHMKKHDFPTS